MFNCSPTKFEAIIVSICAFFLPDRVCLLFYHSLTSWVIFPCLSSSFLSGLSCSHSVIKFCWYKSDCESKRIEITVDLWLRWNSAGISRLCFQVCGWCLWCHMMFPCQLPKAAVPVRRLVLCRLAKKKWPRCVICSIHWCQILTTLINKLVDVT